ncbi:unnamed protein product [Anisakis simplex]|uniref:Large ribosomal subunit protein bL9m n=1 Tax=Anisakis simplex TaxID=6269 RepID=A0A0M3K612_ANISI|nr:unnamed protein product [Anisakis simplex]
MILKQALWLSKPVAGLVLRQSVRSTWILNRVYNGSDFIVCDEMGRLPKESTHLPNMMKYEVIDFESKHPAGPIKVILLQDVETVIGHQYDVVEVDRKVARTDLIPSRKAVYASPFDLTYYAAIKEANKEELASRIRIPYEYVNIGRHLMKLIVRIQVSMDNSWVIDENIVKCALRNENVIVTDEKRTVFVDEASAIKGPNFEMEARLIRFYVVISGRYIVPMLGRISHICADDSKQVIYPESTTLTANELSKCGIVEEEPYYHSAPESEIDDSFDVVSFMKSRRR